LKEDEICSEESFLKAIQRNDCVKKDDLRKELKKIYKNRISSGNIRTFLKMGELKLKDDQMADILRIIPIDNDGGISVDAFVEFLYK
jgi:Ca2+-binding EF-hand superfamily protein